MGMSLRRKKENNQSSQVLRIQSYIQLLSPPSTIPPPTPPSCIVTISNSEGLTFNILPCQGLWNRWHNFILSLLPSNRMHTNAACINIWSRITGEREKSQMMQRIVFDLSGFSFLCNHWIKVINHFPQEYIGACLTLKNLVSHSRFQM